MDLINNIFSFSNDRSISLIKRFRMPISAIFKSSLIKFHKFLTNKFFSYQIRINHWKKFTQIFRGEMPAYLIFMFWIAFISFYKRKTSSQFFCKPIKNLGSGITTCKRNFISIIRIVLRLIFRNAQRAFSINKTGKIAIIDFGHIIFKRCLFDVFKNFFSYMFVTFSMIFHNFNLFLFKRFRLVNQKILIDKSFFFS